MRIYWIDWNEGPHIGSEGNGIRTKSYELVVLKFGILKIILNYKATSTHYRKCIMCVSLCVKR